jgi:hypothetical protein
MQITAAQKEAAISKALEGKGCKDIAAAAGIPLRQLFELIELDSSYRETLSRARDTGLDTLVDELLEIARDESMQVDRARLLCDSIKWTASRRAPRRYGDRLDVNMTQTVDIAGALIDARKRSALPVSNQAQEAIAQVTEYAVIEHARATDTQSVQADEPHHPGNEPSIFD